MFGKWNRPSQELPGDREGWVSGLAFDPIETILGAEAIRVTQEIADGRFQHFLLGLRLTRDLLMARAKREYAGIIARAGSTLFVKACNDLLGACLLMRAGYPLQSIVCLRAAFEAFELLEYLVLHPDKGDEYIAGKPPFDKNLSWIRTELPATDLRQKAYSFFNYFAHANFKGLNIYTTYDASPGVVAVEVGPHVPFLEMVPYGFASALLAYGTRVLWQTDETVAEESWVNEFTDYDRRVENAFSETNVPANEEPD